ncbi:MAG TPA: hypothetical protein VL595_14575 [Pseudonocardia sp.]|nr:hypothetical protein [Pseudonocardia sp.]
MAVVYLFSLAWRAIRWAGRISARLIGSAPTPPPFAPPARREVRIPARAG